MRRPASVEAGDNGTGQRRRRLRRRDPQRLAVTEHDIRAVRNHDVLPPATAGDVAGAVSHEDAVVAGASIDDVSSQAAREHVVAGEPEDPVVPARAEMRSAPAVPRMVSALSDPTMPAASAASAKTRLAATTVKRAARMQQRC